jgi:hypothetical protein
MRSSDPSKSAAARTGSQSSAGWGRPAAVLLAAVLCAMNGTAATQVSSDPLPGEYRVEGGRVDAGTYSGWRIYHTSCHGCHGLAGQGTDIAPNLLSRIKNLTPRGFATKVLTSYRIVDNGVDDPATAREALLEDILKRERRSRGQVVMPAWDSDDQVPPHVLDLYAYLNARADGVLGPGRPRPAAPLRR